MNYPKEAVEAIRRLFQSDSPVSVIINYAAWAHEQLRPRKWTEEKPENPHQKILIRDTRPEYRKQEWTAVWAHSVDTYSDACQAATIWLPVPPLPEPEDPFLEWWEGLKKDGMPFPGVSFTAAKAAYALGVKAGKEGK